MKLRRLALAPCLLSFALFAPLAGAADNLLVNGSFESPDTSVMFSFYNLGSTAITGWTVVGGQIQLTDSATTHMPASDGGQWIDLTGNTGYGKGLMSDAVATVVGRTYELSFDVGDYLAPGFMHATVSVSINGSAPQLFNNIASGYGVMDWERKTLNWVADSSTARITILGAANGSYSNFNGIGLDNVVFSEVPLPVPEPTTWAMLLAGLGLTGALARRRA